MRKQLVEWTENDLFPTEESRGALLEVLHRLVEEQGCLSPYHIKVTAERFGETEADIYGVASSAGFPLQPPAKRRVSICFGSPYHRCQAAAVLEEIEHWLRCHKNRDATDVAISTSKCPGSCSHGPIVVIDGVRTVGVSRLAVRRLLREAFEYRRGLLAG